MLRWNQVALILSVLCLSSSGDDSYAQEEEDMNYYLGRLYEDTSEDILDPHDMLNYPGQKKQPDKVVPRVTKETSSSMFGSEFNSLDKETCSFDKTKLEGEMEKLKMCQEKLKILIHEKETEKNKLKALEKKLMSEGTVDMKAFYRRSVYHIWNFLELEEAHKVLKEKNEALVRHLTVHVSADDVVALQNFMEYQNNVQQVDDFLQEAFELEDVSDENFGISIHSLTEWVSSITEVGKNVEVWLYILCMSFLLLGVWAVYLFIKDIQQELRWMRIIVMMIIQMFFICCLWHWRHMHKVAESRRHAQMMKRGFNNIPEECKPGAQGTTGSIWEWLKVRAFGAPDICEKYFEELMIDPSEEITPAMVIAETLAKFFLQPLQHFGSESAKFITNFYGNVPVVYHIPATVFFVVLLIVILFALCGYGIDFPLWMGGIRPVYRTETADTSDVDRITKEAVAQLKSEREKFMVESRAMLTDIAQAATSSQLNAGIQPLMMMSSGIIESQLERLIARQFSNVMNQNLTPESLVLSNQSKQHNLSHDTEVFTITSTPLRKQCEINHQHAIDTGEVCMSNDVEAEDSKANNLKVHSDAVHYRMQEPRKKDLVPRSDRNCSSSSSSSIESCKQKEKVNHTTKYLPSNTSTAISTDMSVIKKQRTSWSDDHSNPSCKNSEPSSSQSLNETNPEAVLNDETDSGENFVNKVRNLLEDSANSSIDFENSDLSRCDHSSRRITRSLTASDMDIQEDEVELSTSGVEFLRKIKKVMTP